MRSSRGYGRRRPTSVWRVHRDILAARHLAFSVRKLSILIPATRRHSPAQRARGILAFHYMVAVTGGTEIRCAPYRTFGTQELSDAALGALGRSKACLLANHGVIALGADVREALKLAARS